MWELFWLWTCLFQSNSHNAMWTPQLTKWISWCEEESVLCQVCWHISINKGHEVSWQRLWNLPNHWPSTKGKLEVRDHQYRLAMNTTHYSGEHFLMLIKCGPFWFVITAILTTLCQCHSPIRTNFFKILMENLAFTCKQFKNSLSSRDV